MSVVNIPNNQIIKISDFVRKFKEVNKKIEKDQVDFIFKNNAPDKVIMTFNRYQELMEYIEYLKIGQVIEEDKLTDNGKRYSIDEAIADLD